MKKHALPLLFAFLLPLTWSCSSTRLGGYTLNEVDAAMAIRDMLRLGAQESNLVGAFSKERIMTTLFPENVRKTLNTLNQLGLTSEIDRFTTTLGTAGEKTAQKSVPIVVTGVTNMQLSDAMRIVKAGGTAATDYLRITIGDSLRTAIRPVMLETLNEYKLYEKWESIVKPVKNVPGNLLNLDLATLMAGAVTESMFRELEEKEREIRSNATSRTTPVLQKVFSRNWN